MAFVLLHTIYNFFIAQGDNRFVEDAKQRWYDDRKAMHLGINKIIPVLTEQGLISSQEAIKYSLSGTSNFFIIVILSTHPPHLLAA